MHQDGSCLLWLLGQVGGAGVANQKQRACPGCAPTTWLAPQQQKRLLKGRCSTLELPAAAVMLSARSPSPGTSAASLAFDSPIRAASPQASSSSSEAHILPGQGGTRRANGIQMWNSTGFEPQIPVRPLGDLGCTRMGGETLGTPGVLDGMDPSLYHTHTITPVPGSCFVL